MRTTNRQPLPVLQLLALSLAALCIHGYHLGVDDAEIYHPSARKLLNPQLYPFNGSFFLSHAHLSLFSPLLATTARLSHLSIDAVLFGWYLVTLFAAVAACWKLASVCFASSRARWSAVALVTAVISMPAANTGLLLMDPYLTARSFSTPLTLFALAFLLEERTLAASVAIVLTASLHPQMAAYLVFFAAIFFLMRHWPACKRLSSNQMAAFAGILPTGFHLAAADGAYREALYSRDYYFLANWAWYHWLGMIGPLAFFYWFSRSRLRNTRPAFARLSMAVLPFGIVPILIALFLSSSHRFDSFARLQPLRVYHLITLLLILLLGGVLGEYLSGKRIWIMVGILLAASAGLFASARMTYPNSPQIECPGVAASNPWVRTLYWIRSNTPQNAVFALDAHYLSDPVSDLHGFRAISERSSLADYVKDGGAVSIFPALAENWKQQSTATTGLNHFKAEDFAKLHQQYPVASWTVLHGNAPAGLECPYQQDGYAVCLIR